jgi:hypothetical protein
MIFRSWLRFLNRFHVQSSPLLRFPHGLFDMIPSSLELLHFVPIHSTGGFYTYSFIWVRYISAPPEPLNEYTMINDKYSKLQMTRIFGYL